ASSKGRCDAPQVGVTPSTLPDAASERRKQTVPSSCARRATYGYSRCCATRARTCSRYPASSRARSELEPPSRPPCSPTPARGEPEPLPPARLALATAVGRPVLSRGPATGAVALGEPVGRALTSKAAGAAWAGALGGAPACG